MTKLSAHEFTACPPPAQSYSFGIERESAAEALRRLADRIENGEATIESVRVQSLATAADFTATLIRLKIFELKPRAAARLRAEES